MVGIIDRIRGWIAGPQPRNAGGAPGAGVTINNAQQLEEYLRTGEGNTASGSLVTPTTALRVATVYGCNRIIAGTVANMPVDIKRRISATVREDVSDEPIARILQRKPNRWQTPSQFKRMLQTHVNLRGNGYAMKVTGVGGKLLELIPLMPDRVKTEQLADLSLQHTYTRRDGRKTILKQEDVFHLVGLTLDGVTGVSPITYARETIGLSMAQDTHGAATFKNGARISSVLTHPSVIGAEGRANLKASLDEYRAGGESEGKDLILEEGVKVEQIGMNLKDAEWIESRKLTRSDIAMFYGVPPYMLGDTEKSTSWGSGIEQQGITFISYTAEDHLTMWEEAIRRDCIPEARDDLYVRFNRNALVRGDYKTRMAGHALSLQWGIRSPDEVRALEDLNPRPDGQGDKFYDPPNTAGGQNEGSEGEPAKSP